MSAGGSRPARLRLVRRLSGWLALLVTAPLSAATALVVWAFLGRPVLFRQDRVGLGGEVFVMLKFRTMVEPQPGQPRWSSDVERTPRAGRWIRAVHLDELPNLLNIARGEMAWIGPRALPPKIHHCLPVAYQRRTDVLPGLTGVGQTLLGTAAPLSAWLAADCRYAASPGLRANLALALRMPSSLLTRSRDEDWDEVDDIGLAECLDRAEAAEDRPAT
jgi:lipopolysaccharide/colanic/teichoic acid biosynthesis glycosyltransferase